MGSSVVLATAGYDHTIRLGRPHAFWLKAKSSRHPSCCAPLKSYAYISGPLPRHLRDLACGWRCLPSVSKCIPSQSAVTSRAVWRARRFWEATTGICYRTLQFAESQACPWTSCLRSSLQRSTEPTCAPRALARHPVCLASQENTVCSAIALCRSDTGLFARHRSLVQLVLAQNGRHSALELHTQTLSRRVGG